MQTAAVKLESASVICVGNYPQESMCKVAQLILIPSGKPFPKTDPLPFDLVPVPLDGPVFTVITKDVSDASPEASSLDPAAVADSLPDMPELDPSSSEIAPFLLSAHAQRATEEEPSLKDVGRDFNDLPCEVALLSACIAEAKKALAKIGEDVHTEIFYDPRHRSIFLAILELDEEGKRVSSAAVLDQLKNTEEDFGPDHVSYLDQICGVRYCLEHLPFYIKRLKRAARRRGGEAYCQFAFSEPFSAHLLLQWMPDVKSVGKALHVYLGGVWAKVARGPMGLYAAKCIHPRHRTAKRAQDVLDYVVTIRQVHEDTFFGAYKWDGGSILINVGNGVIEVTSDGQITFREHSKDDLFTLKLAADYDPEAGCDVFETTLDHALPDQADRHTLQMFTGYILYPGCDYEASLVCYGPGGTGKSTILNGIGNVLGSPLCGKASLEELCKTSGYSLPTIATKMLNLGTELNGTEIEESANFKKLVSGEGMLARQIYCEPGELITTCKLAFLTNNMPRFKFGTDAEARRLRILHFDCKPEVQDPALKAKIGAEASGILNWMVAGLVQLLQEGGVPRGGAAAKRVLDTFNRGNDPVGSFVDDKCVFHPDIHATKRELFDAFDTWCKHHGLASGDKMENFFWKTLRQRHDLRDTKVATTKGARRENSLSGIALRHDPDADLD